MITLYTALGTYRMAPDGTPYILSGRKEYALDTHELLLWSVLAFRILTYEEIRKEFYEKERELHILSDAELDHYLNRLTVRQLVVSGRDETGMDALYDLLGHLYVERVPSGLFTKIAAFLKLILVRHIPLKKAMLVFQARKVEPYEKKLLKLLKYQILSTAELVQCAMHNQFNIKNSRQLIDCIYGDENADYQTIVTDGRTLDARYPVVEAVANLYLKQCITLQIL